MFLHVSVILSKGGEGVPALGGLLLGSALCCWGVPAPGRSAPGGSAPWGRGRGKGICSGGCLLGEGGRGTVLLLYQNQQIPVKLHYVKSLFETALNSIEKEKIWSGQYSSI